MGSKQWLMGFSSNIYYVKAALDGNWHFYLLLAFLYICPHHHAHTFQQILDPPPGGALGLEKGTNCSLTAAERWLS